MFQHSPSRSFVCSSWFPSFIFHRPVYCSYGLPCGWVVYVYSVHGRFVHVSDAGALGHFMYFVSQLPF